MFACSALSPAIAIAQEGADEVIEEIEVIVTIGTRRTGRTTINTAVPIDVFSREDLDSISSDDMLDTIEKLVPSFILPVGGGDGASFIRPPQLRGLSGDKMLVLVNGKRRHRAALVRLGGDGAHGPDLATIPSIAVKSIEVLRDGASALYGSDAIAGVFNYNLRDAADGGELRLQTGMYTAGNETGYLIALKGGEEADFGKLVLEVSKGDGAQRQLELERHHQRVAHAPKGCVVDAGALDTLDTDVAIALAEVHHDGRGRPATGFSYHPRQDCGSRTDLSEVGRQFVEP